MSLYKNFGNISKLTITKHIFSTHKSALSQHNSTLSKSTPPKMYGAQFNQNLPKQPVPPLNQTLEKYFKSVQPFLGESQLKNTKRLIDEFQSGVGPQLQKLLEEKAKITDNWSLEWIIDFGYLERRYPVAIRKAPALLLPIEDFQDETQRLQYSAKLISAVLDFKSAIDSGRLPVDTSRGDPLDMSEYTKFFGTCRIPGSPKDKLEFNPDSRHVVVVKNNNYFKLLVINDAGKSPGVGQLVDCLQEIVEQSGETAAAVGSLTTENRDTWAAIHQDLTKDPVNLRSVREIETALFVICLDNAMAKKYNGDVRTTALHQLIDGGGAKVNTSNRWFDKTIQFVVGRNGVVGIIFEHSPTDGQPIGTMGDYLVDLMTKVRKEETSNFKNVTPERLIFNIDDKLGTAIETAGTNVDKSIANFDTEFFKFARFGKDFVKSHNLSPDSFIQMAIQYAFYRIHKIAACQGEPGGLKRFLYGRTETIRSCSNESLAFAKTMLDPAKSDAERLTALKLAVNSHKKLADEAVRGFGIDRHLLGLRLTAVENGLKVPEIFTDPVFNQSSYDTMGTSQVYTKYDGVMCFGPRVPDGYLCCYNPRANDINFGIAAYEPPGTAAPKLREALEESLEEMADTLVKT